MQEHWFSLRKVNGQWWNFNSLLPAPEQLSQFYLSAYLATLRDQGYSIFVVHGSLPTYPDTTITSDQGTWWTESQVLHNTAGKEHDLRLLSLLQPAPWRWATVMATLNPKLM